jgi:hypothetical protein
MNYTELKKEYVIETLGKGNRVIMCDFATMRMVDCGEMTVSAINSFLAKPETKFYKEVVNE